MGGLSNRTTESLKLKWKKYKDVKKPTGDPNVVVIREPTSLREWRGMVRQGG